MAAVTSWLLTIGAMLGLVLALHHLGVDVIPALAVVLHGAEHFLGQPLPVG